jgi:hypothetical protein
MASQMYQKLCFKLRIPCKWILQATSSKEWASYKLFNVTKLIWNHKAVLQNSKARPHQPSNKTWDSEIYKRTARLKAIFEIINEIYQKVQTRIIQ